MAFSSEAGGSERAMRHTLTVAFLVLVFSFPLQMFATDVLVQNFSSFVKNTATTRWQHPCYALINTIAAQAVSQHALLAVFCMHVTNASSEPSKLL